MILTISRAEHFSPNSVEKDAAILEALSLRLKRMGFDVGAIGEEELTSDMVADAYISMSRSERTASILRQLRERGAIVIAPSIDANLLTNRFELEKELNKRGMPQMVGQGWHGYWIKKCHGYTETESDIVFAKDDEELKIALDVMEKRLGAGNVYVTPHVKGDLVKFYGVEGTDFFETYYPGDDGCTKFAHERHNGKPHHYGFDKNALRNNLDSMAHDHGVTFYGGDCIVDENGKTYIVDFNDWPSYSRCNEKAADAMLKAVIRTITNKGKNMPNEIDGYIFDYGGTLDTGGDHWGKVLWHAYQHQGVPIEEKLFREAYVYAERTLGKNPIIKPFFTFRDTLSTKLDIELDYIKGVIKGFNPSDWHDKLLEELYERTKKHTSQSADVLKDIRKTTGKGMVLVSNFYGNVTTVLKEFGLDGLFDKVIESAVVGIRKPDPAIFTLGVKALGTKPENTMVVGDSYDKDIVPASKAGCHTIWFFGEGWTNDLPNGSEATRVITSISAMRSLVKGVA